MVDGRENEIAMHVRAARSNGVAPAEIAEALLHTAVYAGVPASTAVFAIAQRTLADLGEPEVLATPTPTADDDAGGDPGGDRGPAGAG